MGGADAKDKMRERMAQVRICCGRWQCSRFVFFLFVFRFMRAVLLLQRQRKLLSANAPSTPNSPFLPAPLSLPTHVFVTLVPNSTGQIHVARHGRALPNDQRRHGQGDDCN